MEVCFKKKKSMQLPVGDYKVGNSKAAVEKQ